MGGARLSHTAGLRWPRDSSNGRVKHGLGGGYSRWARPTRLALHRTRETGARLRRLRLRLRASSQRKRHALPVRHRLRHTLQGPHGDCTVHRGAATGPLRTSSAARSLSFSLPESPRSLAPSLSQPSAVPRPAATRSLRLTPPTGGCLCLLWPELALLLFMELWFVVSFLTG
jgi:hypothetical protein